MDAFDAIFARRSIGRLADPAPSTDELDRMLGAATAAPDHEELRPWRFVVLEGEGKDEFGKVLADSYVRRAREVGAEPTPGQLEKERTKLGRAPVVVVVGAAHTDGTTVPWIEQQAAVAAATQNLLLAATALGYGSMWRTGDAAYDRDVLAAVGLGEHDAILGFVYIGTIRDGAGKPRREPALDGVVTRWRAAPPGS